MDYRVRYRVTRGVARRFVGGACSDTAICDPQSSPMRHGKRKRQQPARYPLAETRVILHRYITTGNHHTSDRENWVCSVSSATRRSWRVVRRSGNTVMRPVERRRIAHASDRLERHRVARRLRPLAAAWGRNPRPKIGAGMGEGQSGMSHSTPAALVNDLVWRSMSRCSRRRQRVQSAIAWSCRWGMRTSRHASCQIPAGPEHCPTGVCTRLNCRMICGCAAVGGIAYCG